jgi:predicted secreted protein
MLRITMLCGLLFLGLSAYAEVESYNRVNFQVEVSREVANDLLVANLSSEIQDKKPALVAQRLNAALNDALRKASAFTTVKASSGNQNTRPVYNKDNKVEAWRGHAEVRLESRDFKAAGELIMQLQQSMQLANIQFNIAPDTRAQIENELVTEAIKAFQARANAISAAMGASKYKNVNLSINNTGGRPTPYPRTMMRNVMTLEANIPAPEFAAGESLMTVQVNGIIELQ